MNLKIKKLHPNAIIPIRSNPTDSGLDLCSMDKVLIKAEQRKMIHCGIAIELPKSTYIPKQLFRDYVEIIWEAQIRPRSGLAKKYGITIVNSPGTIDNSYKGEICVILHNTGSKNFLVEKGMRIAQMVICPIVIPEIIEVDELDHTDRGENGFGSTGK